MKKIYSILILFSFTVFFVAGVLRSNGYVGATEKDGGTGCNCHNYSPSNQVNAWIEGPDSVLVGTSANYKLYITGGPKIRGGFNLASLNGKVAPFDGFTKLMQYVPNDSQLTHSSPQNFSDKDTIFWNFIYRAPSNTGFDTVYSVVNSTNGNGIADGNDRWNFGRKFIVKIYNNPVSVESENSIVDNFILHQNYPNPFSANGGSISGGNPTTTIKYSIPSVGEGLAFPVEVTLKVYDITGREVASLVNERQAPGNYEVKFSPGSLGNGRNLPSGVYIYKLESGNYKAVRKLILLK